MNNCAKCGKDVEILISWCNLCNAQSTVDCWLEHKKYIRHYCCECIYKIKGVDDVATQTSEEEVEREA